MLKKSSDYKVKTKRKRTEDNYKKPTRKQESGIKYILSIIIFKMPMN